MFSAQRTASIFILLTLVLVATPALPITKSHPNLSGVWKLDRDLTTAPYVKDDILVVHQSKQRVRFTYQTDGKVTGTDVFVTDGKEADRYKTRIERAYYRALWKENELVITTYHALDIFGYQNYKETDSWTLDDDGKTLTQHLSDGKVAVYYYKAAAPDDRADETKEFRAVAVYKGGVETSATADCRFDLSGDLKSSLIGKGTYRLCLAPDPDERGAAVARCNPLRGTMNITGDDGFSTFVMKVSGRYCPKDDNFVGSYEVDPDRITGSFNQRLSGGSGMVEFSRSTDTVVLYGVLLYE
jgi:hypothetical protein